jgi:hypothetical protein
MFLIVALLALACAGMMYRTPLWANIVFTLSVTLFVVALIRAIGMRARERVAAVVFGTLGIAYLLLMTSSFFEYCRSNMLTNYPLAWAAKGMRIEALPVMQSPIYYSTPIVSQAVPTISSPPVVMPSIPSVMMPSESDDGTTETPQTAVPEATAQETAAPPTLAPLPADAETPASTPPPAVTVSPFSTMPYTISTYQSQPVYPISSIIQFGLTFGNASMPIAQFFLIGHCVWSWLLAVLGAWLAGRMYDRRVRIISTTTQPATP